MNFKGYLLKIDGREFPNKFIFVSSYKSTPNQLQDLNSYRDANGKLHRNVLPHTLTKIEFNTPPLNLAKKIELQSYFPSRERLEVEYWNDETNDYRIGTFYMPDIPFEIYRLLENDIQYKQTRIALIEY